MPITFKDIRITDCGVGFSVPQGSQLNMDVQDVTVVRTGKVFEERSLFQDLVSYGLRPDADQTEVARILTEMQLQAPQSPAHAYGLLEKAGLGKWVANASGLATIAQVAWDWYSNGVLTQIVAKLTG